MANGSRRYQNRISQRNHRKRVGESLQNANGGSGSDSELHRRDNHGEHHRDDKSSNVSISQPQSLASPGPADPVRCIDSKTQNLAPSRPDIPSGSIMNPQSLAPQFLADDVWSPQSPSSWPQVDPMMRVPMSQPLGFKVQNCTCNDATGPCPGHLEKIRSHIFADATLSSPLLQQYQNFHASSLDMQVAAQLPQPPLTRYNSSSSSKPIPQQQRPHSNSRGTNHPGLSAPSPANVPLAGGVVSSLSGNAHESSAVNASSTDARLGSSSVSPSSMTHRFGIVLEGMRAAGFQDFDAMVAAYYTAEFETGSFPAMLQCASRSRRVKAMLKDIQSNSSQWPQWESRGLHESLSEATASICVEEMDNFNRTKAPDPPQTDPASLVAAVEWLLEERGCSLNCRTYSSPLNEWTRSEQTEAVPDSLPYLWSVLTVLAGAQGIYCDRIARVVMAILLYARRTQ